MIEQYQEVSTEYSSYLNDESGLVRGTAEKILFPRTETELLEIIVQAYSQSIPITVSGGGTGLSGGRVPLGGWIIATDKMREIAAGPSREWTDPDTDITYHLRFEEVNKELAYLTLPVAMTLKAVQNFAREHNWFYPPDSTERGSFIGGNVATNASGARTFKFGPTRPWVQGLRVIIPPGHCIVLRRDQARPHYVKEDYIILIAHGEEIRIPRPDYELPQVTKNVAGPVITDNSHPIDLFIGTNGIFGVISEVTLRLTRPPEEIASIFVMCKNLDQAFDVIRVAQEQRGTNSFPVPMSVEFLDDRATRIVKQVDPRIPPLAHSIIMLEQDVRSSSELYPALEWWKDRFDELEILDTSVALTHAEIEHHKELRHSVPEHVLSLTRSHDQSLVATDYSVPQTSFSELFYHLLEVGAEFESLVRDGLQSLDALGYVFFAHAGDSHVHLTLLPRNDHQADTAKARLAEIAEKVVSLGGSIAAEHGLGKKTLRGKPALYTQYGEKGLRSVRSMKLSIDPLNLLNRGNLIG